MFEFHNSFRVTWNTTVLCSRRDSNWNVTCNLLSKILLVWDADKLDSKLLDSWGCCKLLVWAKRHAFVAWNWNFSQHLGCPLEKRQVGQGFCSSKILRWKKLSTNLLDSSICKWTQTTSTTWWFWIPSKDSKRFH